MHQSQMASPDSGQQGLFLDKGATLGDVIIRPPLWQPPITSELRRGEETIKGFEQAWLRDGLLELPLLERAIIVWHYGIGVPELETAEIAARLAIPHARVAALKEAALTRLRLKTPAPTIPEHEPAGRDHGANSEGTVSQFSAAVSPEQGHVSGHVANALSSGAHSSRTRRKNSHPSPRRR